MGFLWCFEVVRCQSKSKVCCISKFSLSDLESSRVTFEMRPFERDAFNLIRLHRSKAVYSIVTISVIVESAWLS